MMVVTAYENMNFDVFINTSISLIFAFILGTLIGIERQYRQRTAGLRTNVLVAVGAALFVDMAATLNGHEGAVHVIAYVVSGIGFLGAGAIMREDGGVKGLNTAATLWGSAAVGACAGADLIIEAILGTIVVLAANTLLRPIANKVNQQPIKTIDMEGSYVIHMIANKNQQKSALSFLIHELTTSGFPTRDLDVHAFGEDEVEIEAIVQSSGITNENLDKIVKTLTNKPFTNQAFWSVDNSE